MYAKNEFIKNWHDEIDIELYEKKLSKLYQWKNLNRMDELINLLDSLCGNKEFLDFVNNFDYSIINNFKLDLEKSDFYNVLMNSNKLYEYLPIYLPRLTKKLVQTSGIESTLVLIESSFLKNQNKMTIEDDIIIKFSDFISIISFYVEDFDCNKNTLPKTDYNYYDNFFKKIKNIYWKNKKVKKLDDTIYNFFIQILVINKISPDFTHCFYQSAVYLMACNALKNNRDSVNCEDVIVGYLTGFKIIFTDITKLVYNNYNKEKWSEHNLIEKEPYENTTELYKKNYSHLTNNNFVKCWPDESEMELYEESLEKLYQWRNIPRLDELIEVMDSLCGNKQYLNLFQDNNIAYEEEIFVFNMKKIPIYHGLEDSFGFLSKIPLYLPGLTKKLVEFDNIITLFSLIQINYVKNKSYSLKQYQDKSIKLSDILYMITFYLDDFDNPNNKKNEYTYEYYHEFFKKIHKMYWEDDNAKKLDNDIQDFQTQITFMNHLSFKIQRTFSFATLYVMACNAMKNNRENINCEDVVVGYLTCFKILLTDMKPIVHKLYNDEKWLKEDSYL